MGLRTAPLRVMAPALTEPPSQQPQSKSLTAKGYSKLSPAETMSEPEMGLTKNTQLDQLIGPPASPPNDVNVDDLMQVIKTIPEEDLLDVDMMNISMEEQPDLKDIQAKESLAELKQAQVRIERRLDFLRRKIRKLQARTMGAHVGGEVAGVFEYVHRSLKRLKDTANQLQQEDEDAMMKPASYGATKAVLKKLEMAATLQANSMARQKHLKYFGSGSTEPSNHRLNVPGIVNVPPWPAESKHELQKVAGLLNCELGVVQKDVDSEATESSSGGESCDEMQSYNNPHQQYLSIQKRALWKYASHRAAIASRWTWLQAQISDLEYRIRQHGEIQRQVRSAKGEIRLGGISPPPPTPSPPPTLNHQKPVIPTTPTTVNGYRGQLPGDDAAAPAAVDDAAAAPQNPYQCARTRPLLAFKKRKLLQLNGLHVVSKKAARPSGVRCGCSARATATTAPCAVCTGRTDPTHPRDATEAMGRAERVALVDPGYHPVISMPEDVSYAIHCEAIMKNPEWQQRSTRMKSLKVLKGDRSEKSMMEHRSKKLDHRKKYGRLLKPSTMSALSAKIKNKIRGRKPSKHSSSSLSFKKRPRLSLGSQLPPPDAADEEVESIGNNGNAASSNSAAASPSSSPLLQMQAISGYSRRNRSNSYDIDNIVIPYSVAASTRVEKLQYKEILTPKWRIADIDFKCDKNNGAVRNPSQDSDAEDLSEEAVVARHDKCEYEEKKKFLSYLKLPLGHGRSRSHKRTDSLAESSGANTPDPMSPHPPDAADALATSPITSPPATPLSQTGGDDLLPMRKRAASLTSRLAENGGVVTPEADVPPYENRTFPLDDATYEKMLKNMPENHFQTNYRAQDSGEFYFEKLDSPGSESTESALGDEDPNDPEWVDMERVRDRHKR